VSLPHLKDAWKLNVRRDRTSASWAYRCCVPLVAIWAASILRKKWIGQSDLPILSHHRSDSDAKERKGWEHAGEESARRSTLSGHGPALPLASRPSSSRWLATVGLSIAVGISRRNRDCSLLRRTQCGCLGGSELPLLARWRAARFTSYGRLGEPVIAARPGRSQRVWPWIDRRSASSSSVRTSGSLPMTT
jgi:hypothetical protein